ncbi:FAD-binding oxidoreductase [Chlorobium phaeobacteroides]|jgi:D-lactate dehydrogenase (cytochrome)|uniref:FAD linked oxidase domain protein n=1 Tax=Chlorobium phaeobacteroides (strain DSM 266 / SMG 266 / 2430) TaxID=290317 RepID=A1BEP0_CHLPD|nr:FAD-binding oxidoreductase [Chlorobium phaeobacteroides]ABL64867.1 FAD linked oxidase domain protein [Chlorobium phaeobacteroides DSM 266]MBV5328581.1 FAD-binding oxidoreductase [Chlorobium sp.]
MIFKNDPASIQSFLEDTSNIRTGATPGVYFPENAADIAGLLKEAAHLQRRYTIAGNGTGTTGGRIPDGSYVISMQNLRSIGEIRELTPTEALITVEAGALLEDIQKKTQHTGWLYPPDPTETLCFIGSTIANNSSGSRSFKYGPTRNHIRRILAVLPEGDILNLTRGEIVADRNGMFHLDLPVAGQVTFSRPDYPMPATSKHNAGYYSREGMDLVDLFIGSEGTLGVIIEADLILIREPEKFFSCMIFFQDIDDLFRFVAAIKQPEAIVSPRVVELFDENSLLFLQKQYPNIPHDVKGAIFIEQETTRNDEDHHLEAWLELMERHRALSDASWVALDRKAQQELTAFRHALPILVNEWLSKQQESKISTDMAVPDSVFRELFDFYTETCRKNGFAYIIFGHIGNAHVHLNILPRNRDEFMHAKKLYLDFVDKVLKLGGTLSAEHGIGKLKAEYLVRMYGEKGIQEMATIKKSLDPFLVLNIGNLIPVSYLKTANH